MKKLIFALGLASCLTFAGMTGAEASTTVTFTGGQSCTCTDGDNWVDFNTPASVSLTCTGTGNSLYHDTALPNNMVQEYSCSTFPGATNVLTDNKSKKVLVSYVTKKCPKGYTAAYTKKSVKATLLSPEAEKKLDTKTTTVQVGYCAKVNTASPAADTASPAVVFVK